MASFQDRVVGALRLQPATFEDVEHDPAATAQAAIIVVAGAVAGSLSWFTLSGMVMAVVVGLLGWAIGAFVILMVGTKLFPGKNTEADMGQMLRVLGFAQSASLFNVLGIVPLVGFLVALVVWVWVLVAMVIGVRQALDYDDTMKAVIVCIVAWVIMLVVSVVAGMFGVGAAGLAGGMM